MNQDFEDPSKEVIDQVPQVNFVNGYKSLLESYNLMSQSFSRYSELNQSSHILTQLQELTKENSKIKQENLYLQELIHKLSTDIYELQNKPALSSFNLPSAPEKVPNFIHQVHSVSMSQDLIENYKAEISSLKFQVQELMMFKTLSAELEHKNIELNERIVVYEADNENLKTELENFKIRVKKLEDSLEVTKVHRDLLRNKIEKLSIIGNEEQKTFCRQDDLIDVEKRFKVLEDRIKGTDEVENYIRKYKEALEKLAKSDLAIKNLHEKLDTSIKNLKNAEKNLDLEKNKNTSCRSPQILEKLVSLIHNHQKKKNF